MERRTFLSGLAVWVGSLSTFPLLSGRLSGGVPTYEEVRRLLAGRRLFLVPYSHNDWAWTHTRHWQEERASLVLSEVLTEMKRVPEYRFFVDTWNELLEPFLARNPEKLDELGQLVRQGRLAICGGTWANQHPGWMEPESLLRNMVQGRRRFNTLFPDLTLDVMVHYDVTPGGAQMPQILRKAGYSAYRFFRPDEALTAQGIPRNFVWRGLDGSEILVSRGGYGGLYTRESIAPFETDWKEGVVHLFAEEIERRLEPGGGRPVWVSQGSDDSRPLRSGPYWDGGTERVLPMEELLREWNRREAVPFTFATPVEYFRELRKDQAQLDIHQGVLDPTMWTFWYGLNGNDGLRVWRTRTDQALLEAEIFSSVASTLGLRYPETEIDDIWKELLSVYSHAQMWLYRDDYEEQLNRAKLALGRACRSRDQALRHISSRVASTDKAPAAIIFNPLPWDRVDCVELWAGFQEGGISNFTVRTEDGKDLPFQVLDVNWKRTGGGFKEALILVQVPVPGVGYTTLFLSPADGTLPTPSDPVPGASLDSSFARLEFSQRGIESLTDKVCGLRYETPANVSYVETEPLHRYHYGPVVRTLNFEDAVVAEIRPGQLASRFRIEGRLGEHSVRLQGLLFPLSRRLSMRAEIESKGGSGHFVTGVALPGEGRLIADVAFGIEERDLSRIEYQGVERLRENVFYGSHWVNWMNRNGGVTLVGTTGEKGYQMNPRDNFLSHFLLMTVPPAQPDNWQRFVTTAREGKGRHAFEYHFLFHGRPDEGDVSKRTLEIRFPLRKVYPGKKAPESRRLLPAEKSFLSIEPTTVHLSAFFKESERYLLRLFESSGKATQSALQLPFQVAAAEEVDFNGRKLGRSFPVDGSQLNLRLRPWEIVTIALSPQD